MKYIPKISIITITFNAEQFIEKTIQSVINQGYSNIEYIIIDGKSTDGTLEIVKKYEKSITKIISEPDSGIYDAMNKGLKVCTGEWINFLNAGDIYAKNEMIFEMFSLDKNKYNIIYGDWINTNSTGFSRRINSTSELSLKTLRKNFELNHQALFVRNKNLPYYKSDIYKIKADYQWLIDIVRNLNTDQILYINSVFVYYDIDGISAKFILLNLKEYLYLTYKNFGFLQVIKNSPIYIKYLVKYFITFFTSLRKN